MIIAEVTNSKTPTSSCGTCWTGCTWSCSPCCPATWPRPCRTTSPPTRAGASPRSTPRTPSSPPSLEACCSRRCDILRNMTWTSSPNLSFAGDVPSVQGIVQEARPLPRPLHRHPQSLCAGAQEEQGLCGRRRRREEEKLRFARLAYFLPKLCPIENQILTRRVSANCQTSPAPAVRFKHFLKAWVDDGLSYWAGIVTGKQNQVYTSASG